MKSHHVTVIASIYARVHHHHCSSHFSWCKRGHNRDEPKVGDFVLNVVGGCLKGSAQTVDGGVLCAEVMDMWRWLVLNICCPAVHLHIEPP